MKSKEKDEVLDPKVEDKIFPLTLRFGTEDMNLVVDKINELIAKQ